MSNTARSTSPRKTTRKLKTENVRRNSEGGVYVSMHDIKQTFAFFDADNKGHLTLPDLKKKLGAFYQNLSLREYKFLMNNKNELTEQDLQDLLLHNEVQNFDPVAEAFKIFDPKETGSINSAILEEILSKLGFTDITSTDIQALLDTADVDRDGAVSLTDFRKMLDKGS